MASETAMPTDEPTDRSTKHRPMPAGRAVVALVGCGVRTVGLLARTRLHQPPDHVGRRLRFADGTSAPVYRETVVDRRPTSEPSLLVVSFRLRRVRNDRLHRLFRLESVLNTLLFAGFPGFVSKLWLAHDERGVYRGVYEWDGAERADDYVRALWWALAIVSHRQSIRWHTVPGQLRDDVLADPSRLGPLDSRADDEWWRLIDATSP